MLDLIGVNAAHNATEMVWVAPTLVPSSDRSVSPLIKTRYWLIWCAEILWGVVSISSELYLFPASWDAVPPLDTTMYDVSQSLEVLWTKCRKKFFCCSSSHTFQLRIRKWYGPTCIQKRRWGRTTRNEVVA